MISSELKSKLAKIRFKSNFQMTLGIILIVLMAMALMGSHLPESKDDIDISYACLFISSIGLLLCYFSLANKNLINLYGKYSAMFKLSRAALELDYVKMSEKLHLPVAKVKREVAKLLKLDAWESVHGGRAAVEAEEFRVMSEKEKFNAKESEIKLNEAKKIKTLTCHDCGGTTTVSIYESTPKCEYCESSLSEEIMANMKPSAKSR